MSKGTPLKGGRSFFITMSTFVEFSDALYEFHRSKAGKNDGQYNSIESLCKVAKDYFETELAKIDEQEFIHTYLFGKTAEEKKEVLTKWIRHNIDEINKFVKSESENDLNAAIDLYALLFNKETGVPKYKHLASTVKKHTDFYRIRKADKYEIYDKKGIFLLSDRLEHLAGSYRFNPSGYACLYLASNLYLAWEECRRPDFETFSFSRFQNMRDIKVLDLTIRRDYFYREHFLLAYLTLLCCAKTTDEDKHKFQYVVPQMLMKVLCTSQRKMKEKSKDMNEIAGIKYMSSRRYDQRDLLFDDKTLTEAYVFPQRPHNEGFDVCPFLANLFRLTEPRSFFLFKSHRFNFFNRTAYVSNYQDSLFYQLEETLKKEKLKKYDE
mgnify:CR=1 FL=1